MNACLCVTHRAETVQAAVSQWHCVQTRPPISAFSVAHSSLQMNSPADAIQISGERSLWKHSSIKTKDTKHPPHLEHKKYIRHTVE